MNAAADYSLGIDCFDAVKLEQFLLVCAVTFLLLSIKQNQMCPKFFVMGCLKQLLFGGK